MTSARLRVSTLNVQNFPDMTDEQVRSDVAAAGRVSDLILWQEIGEVADYRAITQVLGHDWGTANSIREVVCSWRELKLLMFGPTRVLPMTPGLGAGEHSPARYLCQQLLSVPGLPPIEVHSIHYIQGAWGTHPISHRPERQRQWREEWVKHHKLVLEAHNAGRIVIFGGDWNRQGGDIPKFHRDQVWIVGGHGGLDHIGVLLPKGVSLQVEATWSDKVNSDHPLRGATIVLSSKVLPPAPPKPAPRPVPHPWLPRTRRWKRRHRALWAKIVAWRKSNPRRKP